MFRDKAFQRKHLVTPRAKRSGTARGAESSTDLRFCPRHRPLWASPSGSLRSVNHSSKAGGCHAWGAGCQGARGAVPRADAAALLGRWQSGGDTPGTVSGAGSLWAEKIVPFTVAVSGKLSPACEEVVGRQVVGYKWFFISVLFELLRSVLIWKLS